MNKPSVNRTPDVREQARDMASPPFETQREKAVDAMDTVAAAIRDTGDKLKGVGPLGQVAERAADRIERAAEFFEGKQIGDVVRDVERFARREPALFLGATFALGLVAGRFLKSSAQRSAGGMRSMPESERGARGEGGGGDIAYERYAASYGELYDEGTADEAFLTDEVLEADADIYPDDEDEDGGRSGV